MLRKNMSLSLVKLTRDDSFEDFEFFDADEEDFVQYNCEEAKKTSIQGAVEKLGSGVALVFSALCSISEEQGLTVTVPIKAVATTAATTLTGSLIGGVPGMAVGLITGAYLTFRSSPNRLKALSPSARPTKYSLRQVIKEMTLQQKKELLRELLACLKQPNLRLLVTEICKNEQIRGIALQVLSDYLFKKMGVNLTKANAMK